MSTSGLSPEQLAELRSLAREWGKIISKRAFGEDGPDLEIDFRAMEAIAAAAAEGLTEGTLQQLLEQQAKKLPAEQPCPDCGRSCPTEVHTRSLSARGARIDQVERIAHCPDCRRDFFPPADDVGPG
ncbi:MAG TPA: hypothetical protein VH092_09985 [Urbifossiella sp.]|jgi:hypothetical protein|nr:hypothetical protein [Urbifossiella sp.]